MVDDTYRCEHEQKEKKLDMNLATNSMNTSFETYSYSGQTLQTAIELLHLLD